MICQRCGVKIEGDIVHFSYGNPGSRSRLYARVCQFALARGATDCANKFDPKTEVIKESDYYN